MKILIAEDDAVSRKLLETQLKRWGYTVLVCQDGGEAWEVMQNEEAPMLAILDWMMPVIDGPEICKRIRGLNKASEPYLILLTSKEGSQNIVSGLEAGADDYITKPFDSPVLHARVRGGLRILELQSNLSRRVKDLEKALAEVKQLRGLLPICSYCKKVRDDNNYWKEVDTYLAENTATRLSHGFCPDCFEKHVKPQLDELDFIDEELGQVGGEIVEPPNRCDCNVP
ncbi:MAG: response regulator [Phycisphaeraceae bacterium]|nr:response regulator [Phycisphaeraceae bacterium]